MARTPNSLRYQAYRSAAMRFAAEVCAQTLDVRGPEFNPALVTLAPIADRALEQTLTWSEAGGLFPWEGVAKWKAHDPKALDLSIWYGAELCGLCYASPRQSAIRIKLLLLEGRPGDPHPLKGEVLALALSAIAHYAKSLRLQFIEVDTPLAGAIPLYLAVGFAFDEDGRLVRAVRDFIS
ncbi:MAG: N-acetyltransferase [Pseudomonas sp.]